MADPSLANRELGWRAVSSLDESMRTAGVGKYIKRINRYENGKTILITGGADL